MRFGVKHVRGEKADRRLPRPCAPVQGAIGYFPSYTLGAMMAVQLFNAARRALPTLDEDLAAVRCRLMG